MMVVRIMVAEAVQHSKGNFVYIPPVLKAKPKDVAEI